MPDIQGTGAIVAQIYQSRMAVNLATWPDFMEAERNDKKHCSDSKV